MGKPRHLPLLVEGPNGLSHYYAPPRYNEVRAANGRIKLRKYRWSLCGRGPDQPRRIFLSKTMPGCQICRSQAFQMVWSNLGGLGGVFLVEVPDIMEVLVALEVPADEESSGDPEARP